MLSVVRLARESAMKPRSRTSSVPVTVSDVMLLSLIFLLSNPALFSTLRAKHVAVIAAKSVKSEILCIVSTVQSI